MEINIGNIIVEEEINIGNMELDIIKDYPKLENLTVIPSGEQQTFKHPNSYGYDNVVVEGVETETLNITPKEETQKYSGLYGEVNVDKITAEEKTPNLDFSNNDVIEVKPSENRYLKKVTINKDEDLLPKNIKSGVDIFGVSGTGEMLDLEINDCGYLFYNNMRINQMNDLLSICKNVTNIDYMFANANGLTDIDVSNLDMKNCKSTVSTFASTSNLKSLDLSSWDTSNVENMTDFIRYNNNLTYLNLSNLNTAKVKKMTGFLMYCPLIEEIDVSSFDTSNVEEMGNMFYNFAKLTSLDISNFVGDKIKYIVGFLGYCTNLTNLNFMSNLGKAFIQKSNNYYNYGLDLSRSTKLTHDSLMDVINKLYDLNLTYNVAGGGTLYTQKLTIGSTNMAKLSADEIAIATNKGWVVS